jgi:hypothetical protein
MYRLAIRGPAALAVVVAVWAAASGQPSPDPASLAVSAEQAARARDLVRLLGSNSFRDRDRAARELAAMGRAALPALHVGRDDPDPEVRMRVAALLPRAEADELRARIETFLADAEAKYTHDLPGFNKFRAVAGDDRAARDLFAEILKNRANYDLLLALRGVPADLVPPLAAAAGAIVAAGPENPAPTELALALAARRQEIQHRLNQPIPAGGVVRSNAPDLPDVALLLLADSLVSESATPPNPFQSQIASFLYQDPLRRTASGDGRYGPVFRRLVVHWMDTREGVVGLQNAMSLAVNLRMDSRAVCKYAVRMLTAPGAQPYYRAQGATMLARHNGRDYLFALTGLFADETVLVPGGPNNPQPEIQVRDVALAMALLLTGQDPSAYGIAVGSTQEGMKYQYANYRFQPDAKGTAKAKRAAAFAKWRDWELGLHAALAGPPAAAPVVAARHAEMKDEADTDERPNGGRR